MQTAQRSTSEQKQQRVTLAMAEDMARALHLAPNFQPDVDLLTSEGLIAFGVKGSGKTNLLALIVEQLRRFHLPQLILDTEGEQRSLLNLLPHGIIATANRCPSGYDIIHKGLQVIVDLRSWESDEAAALAMCQLIGELFAVANAIAPQDRYPCIIHLDEAAYWLPQDSVSYLSKDTRKAVADAFHKLASRGRKQGLTPFLYTQSISEVRKETIRQAGIQVLMRQTLDLDLTRYCEYIHGATAKTRAAIRAYPQGRAVVILPDGSQHRVQFDQRESEHTSHTPKAQAAVIKFAQTSVDVDALHMLDISEPVASTPQRATAAKAVKVEKAPTQPGKAKHAPSIRERVFTLLKRDDTLTARDLAAMVGCPANTAQIYRRDFLNAPAQPPRGTVMELRIRALLTENPDYTASQIAHRTHYSSRDVKSWLTRIQQAQPVNA